MTYIDKVLGHSPIAYWPLNEADGSIANCLVNSEQDGGYTGVTLGETGIGDGETCPFFDGSNDYVDIFSAVFDAAFDGREGTISVWAKVYDSGVWTDNAQRSVIRLYDDGDNRVHVFKLNNSRYFRLQYEADNDQDNVNKTSYTPVVWVHYAFTWSDTDDEIIGYIDGVAETPVTSIGTWDGGGLDSSETTIGAGSTSPATPWHGWLAHCAVFDSALSEANIADLAEIPTAGPQTVTLSTLTLSGSVPSATVQAVVTVTLDTLTLSGSVPSASVTPGAVTVTLDALTLSGSVPSATVQAQVTVTLNALTLGSSVPALTVTPGEITITLDALTLGSSIPSASVTPGAVTVTLDVLTLGGSVPALAVTPGGVTVNLAALTLGSSVTALTVTPGSIIVTLAALTLAATLNDLTVTRGAALGKIRSGWPFWRF